MIFFDKILFRDTLTDKPDRPMNVRQGVIKKAHLSLNLLFHKIVIRRHSNLHGI